MPPKIVERKSAPNAATKPKAKILSIGVKTMIAKIRLREINLLARWRNQFGGWPEFMAGFIACIANCIRNITNGPPTPDRVRAELRAANVSVGDDDIESALAIEQATQPSYANRLLPGDYAGALVELTHEERISVSVPYRRGGVTGTRPIVMMRAIDETDDERAEAVKEARRARDLVAKRLKRGSVPRGEYLAASLAQTRPWESEGIGRRQWERRLKSGMSQVVAPTKYLHSDADIPATFPKRRLGR